MGKKKKKKFTGTSPSDDMTGYAKYQKENWPPPVNQPPVP